MKSSTNLIWIDLEMTGLDPEKEKIIEIAAAVTDKHLNVLATSASYAIHQADQLLEKMDDWNKSTHTRTGLINRVKESHLNEAMVEQKILEFLEPWVPTGKSPLCGNSIHQDRRFLRLYMPKLEGYCHYRHIDVSTIKELAKRWKPSLKKTCKHGAHQALDDVLESIEELRYYRDHFFNLR
jgi:oligoribonuclease